MKPFDRLLFVVVFAMAATTAVPAATVTVNAASGDYTTLQDAMTNMIGGDDWGDGNDTILLDDDQVTILTDTFQLLTKAGGSVTLKNVDGASPVIAADSVTIPVRLIQPGNNGLHVIEGITLLGPAGASGVQTAFQCEATTTTDDIDIVIRDCVVTRNNGSNQPVTNWGSETFYQLTGICDRSLLHGGNTFAGKLDVTVEGCTFAFARGGPGIYGNVEFGSSPRHPDGAEDAHRTLTLRNTLVIMGGTYGIAGRDIFEECTINVIESAILKHMSRGMRFFLNDVGIAHNLFVQDSIVAQNLNEAQIAFADPGFNGVCTLERVTLAGPPNNIAGVFSESHVEGQADFSFTDVIFDSQSNSFRIRPDAANPGSFAIENCVAFTVNPDNGASIIAAFAALYDNTGPFMDPPQYVSTDLSVLDGRVGWYRATNTIYDVGNDTYIGKGSAGGRPQNTLAGGADHTTAVDIVNRVEHWMILQ